MKRFLEEKLGFRKFSYSNLLVNGDSIVHFSKAEASTRKFIVKEINTEFFSVQNCSQPFILIQLGSSDKFALFSFEEVKDIFNVSIKAKNGRKRWEFLYTIIPSIGEDCATLAVIRNINDKSEDQKIAQVPILEKLDVGAILGDYLGLAA